MISSHPNVYREPRQMYGVPGTICVFENSGLRSGFYKIGLTRRSGWAKAIELNRDLLNSIPGNFECVFELQAKNCGAALDDILKELHFCRRGKRNQNFFEIDLNRVKKIITAIIEQSDQQSRTREYQEQALRHYLEQNQQQELPLEDTAAPVGLFKKAVQWMATVTH